ncbi:MAG: ABC transporter ATP-binding protein [Clostridium sp.]|nr:ABC transporter ATP-binding protein [Acetatifactor muris]MCM1526308.1 ABC transporter ATP-binding protein [Bacteroides sp.]MCM1562875.1 ABC transporter ATP-binding protein [Clostridium sp.]
MLYIENLTKKYGSYTAVDHLTLHIPEGDLFGFMGPNGAGKTTTIRIVCGLLKAGGGTVRIGNTAAAVGSKEMKRMIGYVPDFFGVYDNLKVREYMDFYGSTYGMSSRDIARLTDDLLELVNLADKKEVYVDTLSRGMKQRLCVARALLHNPKLLILDEPSSGLDPRARVEMKELLKNLHSMGKTIVISSHILSELSEMCNSIGIMNRGRLMVAGRIEDVMQQIEGRNRIHIGVASDREAAVRLLQEEASVRLESVMENEIVVSGGGTDEEISALIGRLIQNKVILTGFHREEGSLESLFMQLTGGGAR